MLNDSLNLCNLYIFTHVQVYNIIPIVIIRVWRLCSYTKLTLFNSTGSLNQFVLRAYIPVFSYEPVMQCGCVQVDITCKLHVS